MADEPFRQGIRETEHVETRAGLAAAAARPTGDAARRDQRTLF